jgi:NADPH-dependent F420 reductase
MNNAILGTGNMASGLAVLFSNAGHRVTLGSRDATRAGAVANSLGGTIAGSDLSGAARDAEVVVLAVPFDAAGEVIAAAGGLAGRIVVDITNPLTADYSGLTVGHTDSGAENIQRLAPGARVVKAFNTVFASVLKTGGKAAGRPATVFVAGDDAGARSVVSGLAADAGFVPLETGGISAARYLEPLAGLNIALGYGLGHGTDIAPTWQRAA